MKTKDLYNWSTLLDREKFNVNLVLINVYMVIELRN